jgi:hypothetical protein
MAIRELNAVIAANFDIAATTQLHAGSYVARDPGSSLVVAADRALHTAGATLGVLADDTARTGNTMIQVDPVGSTYIDPTTGNFVANNNGYFRAAKRAIGNYQAEDYTDVTNLTAGASGFEGPMRGVGVFTTPSSNLITDQFATAVTADSVTSGATTISDSAFSGGQTFLPNDLLTYGTGVNAGLFVKVATTTAVVNSTSEVEPSTTTFLNGKIVARVDKYDSAAALLYITLL